MRGNLLVSHQVKNQVSELIQLLNLHCVSRHKISAQWVAEVFEDPAMVVQKLRCSFILAIADVKLSWYFATTI